MCLPIMIVVEVADALGRYALYICGPYWSTECIQNRRVLRKIQRSNMSLNWGKMANQFTGKMGKS